MHHTHHAIDTVESTAMIHTDGCSSFTPFAQTHKHIWPEVASRQWQRVPEGVALPAGLEVKFDMDRGEELSQRRSEMHWDCTAISWKSVVQVVTMPGSRPKKRNDRL